MVKFIASKVYPVSLKIAQAILTIALASMRIAKRIGQTAGLPKSTDPKA